jgi:hypothetical protein
MATTHKQQQPIVLPPSRKAARDISTATRAASRLTTNIHEITKMLVRRANDTGFTNENLVSFTA